MTDNFKEKVENILNVLRPYLQVDGGDIEFVSYEPPTSTLVVRFLGNCVNCPISIMTLRAGIERHILKEIPEIRRVEKI